MANKSGDNSLHDWFNKSKSSDGTKGWVQLGGKYAGKPCARQPGQTTKPKCGSSKMKRALNKSEEDAAFRRKNREDGNPNKKGKAKNVRTEGKTFGDFLMQESSLARLASKIEKGGLAHISAERADKSKKENKERSKQLRKDIRGAGLPGATKVEGQYKEAGQDEPSKEETSVVSSGKKSKKKFKKLLKKLAKKYDQDSVLIQKDKDTDGKLHATTKAGKKDLGKWDGKVGRMKPGGSGEMQTRIKGKTYTYE